ncbi:MAG TPA: chloride channel protein, partial [Methanomicrobiales archaeon]|nr:chloride channel protein [Methanomicrobiales archaeon]
VLLLIAATKILVSTWCMATIFKGGPVFPLLFTGGTIGLVISLLFPFIPLAVAVPATMAGMIVCVLKMPIAVIPLVAIFFLDLNVVLFIIVATLVGYYATRHITIIPQGEH